MARGQAAPIGAERWSPNGYHYTKTEHGWDLTSRIMMARKLGRPLLPNERVTFINNDKRDLRIENLQLSEVKTDLKKLQQRKASILDRIRELEALLAETNEEIDKFMQLKNNEGSS